MRPCIRWNYVFWMFTLLLLLLFFLTQQICRGPIFTWGKRRVGPVNRPANKNGASHRKVKTFLLRRTGQAFKWRHNDVIRFSDGRENQESLRPQTSHFWSRRNTRKLQVAFFITFAFPVLPNISEAVVTTGNYKWKCFSTFAFLIEDQTMGIYRMIPRFVLTF